MKKHIVVVGAGMAGLSVAYQALKKNYQVTLVESQPFVGGLSRSFVQNDCILDIGVHLLHLRDSEVKALVEEIVPKSQIIKIKRNGKLFLLGKYIDWPLTIRSGFQLPLHFVFRVLWDQLFKPKKIANDGVRSYQSELNEIYGKTLFDVFFGPLTRKFWKTDPAKIHHDWAYSSIRAATKIEDKEFEKTYKYLTQVNNSKSQEDFNIFKFVWKQLSLKDSDDAFYYFKDGYGVLPEYFEKAVKELGGEILMNTTVSKFIFEGDQIQSCEIAGKQVPVDRVIWTASPSALCELIGAKQPALRFLNSKFLYVFLNKETRTHQVCYYGDAKLDFVRGTVLSNHSKTVIKNSKIKDVICLEYTSTEGFKEFSKNKEVTQRAVAQLKEVGMIESEKDVDSTYEISVPNTYPILELDYREGVINFEKSISLFKNLFIFGRQAGFSYENADVLIKESMRHKSLE